MPPETVWFVEPLNDFTNEILARECNAEDALRYVHTDRGTRNLWRIGGYSMVTRLKAMSGARFSVYTRKGGGRVYYFPFAVTRTRRRNALMRGKVRHAGT